MSDFKRGDNHHEHDRLWWRKLHGILHPADDPVPGRTVIMHTLKNAGQPDTLVIMVTPAP